MESGRRCVGKGEVIDGTRYGKIAWGMHGGGV